MSLHLAYAFRRYLTVAEINRRIANAQWREGYSIGAFHPDTLNVGAPGV